MRILPCNGRARIRMRRAAAGFLAAAALAPAAGLAADLAADLATTAPAPQSASTAHEQMDGHSMAQAHMNAMSGHMHMTDLRPPAPGDQQRADAVAASARAAMAPYKDYKKALADGYEIFLPDVPQAQYHFTRYEFGREARSKFDPAKPTSLLYTKSTDGQYQLVGAMYTDRVDASEEELNARIPLSIARWHQHINFCKAPSGRKGEYFGPHALFGLRGSITTREDCEAAGGEFHPHLFGWMVHVYPYESDPKAVWSTDDDDHGHDNMDRAPLPATLRN